MTRFLVLGLTPPPPPLLLLFSFFSAAGTYCKNGVQELCDGGTYASDAGRSVPCTDECDAGYFCVPGSTSAQNQKCGFQKYVGVWWQPLLRCLSLTVRPSQLLPGGLVLPGAHSTWLLRHWLRQPRDVFRRVAVPPGVLLRQRIEKPVPCTFCMCEAAFGIFSRRALAPSCSAALSRVCVCVSIQGGNYGEEPELTSSECNGPCSAGYFCPPGSTSATEKEVRVCLPISSVHLDPPFSSPSPLSVFIAVWSQHGDSQHGVLPCPQYEPFFAFAVLLWLRLTSLLPRLPTHRRESGPLLHRGFANDAHRRSSVPRRQLLCQRHAV